MNQLDSENGDYDLTSSVTVLTDTPDASNPKICQAYIAIGDGSKDLDGTGGDFEVVITVGSQTLEPSPQTVTFSTATRVCIFTHAFPVPANTEVVIKLKSPNAGDSDVDVTVTLYDVTGGTDQSGDAYAYLGTNLGAAGVNAVEAGGDGDQFTAITGLALSETASNNLTDAFDGTGFAFTNCTMPTVTAVTNGVTLANDAIKAVTYDESTAFPIKSADTGATQIARTGADGDTLEDLSDEIAAGAVAGGSGSTLRNEIHRLAGIDEGTIYGSDLLFALEADETAATWPARPQKISSTWYLFYTAKVSGTNRIRLKTSADGESWSGATDILTPGGSGEWDEGGIWCPQFFAVDGTYYLFYTGYDSAGEGVSVGLATSDTVNSGYTRHGSNPLLTAAAGDFRQGSAEVTGMAQFDGTYYMYLTNLSVNDNDMPSHARKIWYATSDDLTTWTQSTTPIFGDADTSSDRQPGIGYYSASPFASGDYYYLLVAKYGPYNDFSRFELWEADSPTFSADSRRFVKTVLVTQDLGTWPDHEVDICHVATDDIGADTYSLTSNEIWIYFGAKHNRSGTRKWETGLMKYGSLYELLRPTPLITEPIIDRLPQTRWSYGALDALLEGNVTEAYAAQGATTITGQEMWNEMFQCIVDRAQSDTTMTTYQRDGSTPAVTYTLDDATSPTKISRDQS
jgi:predicted GH43/DUF377 family glycosyl hydrolase